MSVVLDVIFSDSYRKKAVLTVQDNRCRWGFWSDQAGDLDGVQTKISDHIWIVFDQYHEARYSVRTVYSWEPVTIAS